MEYAYVVERDGRKEQVFIDSDDEKSVIEDGVAMTNEGVNVKIYERLNYRIVFSSTRYLEKKEEKPLSFEGLFGEGE